MFYIIEYLVIQCERCYLYLMKKLKIKKEFDVKRIQDMLNAGGFIYVGAGRGLMYTMVIPVDIY